MAQGAGISDGDVSPRGDLFTEMRRIKDASQLSYNRLADKTHYSRSSWERFLNGKQVPTRVAVQEFANAAGADPEPLLALLAQLAVREETAPDEPVTEETIPQNSPPAAEETPAAAVPLAAVPAVPEAPAPEPGADTAAQPAAAGSGPAAPAASPGWRSYLPLAACVVAGALLGSLFTVLALGGFGGSGDATAKSGAKGKSSAAQNTGSTPVNKAAAPAKPGCKSDTCLLREPQAEDCQWDAKTVRQTWLRGMSIQLRYSEACQAVWGRVESGNIGDGVSIRDKRGLTDEASIRMEHDTYTRMLAVTPEETWETITICGKIPSAKEQECSPMGAIKP
ncbi:DUF2690 domain-containing protein [Streptomyces sp. NPDC089919]|uniref:helix-turn-helix domain-containing protein n=1 Tax=Streptomyces sp. NPDC089919 TaxID=3155188 RepID=UPI0034161DC4